MDWSQGFDATNVSQAVLVRATQPFRALYNGNFPKGTVCKIVTQDLQQWPDVTTIGQVSGTSASDKLVVGVVSDDWAGFSGASPLVTAANISSLSRGTQIVRLTSWGAHPNVLVDNTSGATITNGTALSPSQNTAGRAQGIATPLRGSTVGFATLPASGLFSSLTQAALTQASNAVAWTVATPASGDTLNITMQIPYAGTQTNIINPGVVVTRTVSATLNGTTAASATTAAAAIVAAFNADSVLSQYYTASNTAGAVTVTVNALATPFFVTYANGGWIKPSLSGSGANGITISASVTGNGGTTFSGGSATLTAGAGFYGYCPAWIETL